MNHFYHSPAVCGIRGADHPLRAAADMSFGTVYAVFNNIGVYGDLKDNVVHEMDDDVGFVNPALGDYRIKDGAEVSDIHFEKIGRY